MSALFNLNKSLYSAKRKKKKLLWFDCMQTDNTEILNLKLFIQRISKN